MFIHYRTQAFILKKEDRDEADQILTLFSSDFGKLEILAKGIRKIVSKLRAGVELFSLSEIEFIQGKNYKTLTDALSIKKFKNLKKSLKRLRIAKQIAEILDQLIKGQEADQKIWQLLKETFQRLDNLEIRSEKLALLYFYFFWNLISILGYRPEVYQCPLCQKRLGQEKLHFDPKSGGVICQKCFKKVKSGIEIKPKVVKILRMILEKDWTFLSRLKLEKIDLFILNELSQRYYHYLLSL